MKRLALTVLSASIMAACSTPLPPAPAPVPQAAAPVQPTVATTATPPAKPVMVAKSQSPLEGFDQLRSLLASKSIYFAYDRYTIASDADPLIEKHAKLLEAYPKDVLTLQGNCDERGGAEYNLALGQRRADAVKEKLVLLGVPAARIETVSFGKEKPRAACHEETCWSQNRRADFVDDWK
jgi:peptidoglycan-associated lipoprotein